MSTKKSEGGDPPSIRGMVRDLVDLGIAAVQKSPSFGAVSALWETARSSPTDPGEAAARPPAAKSASSPPQDSAELDRSLMVEARVINNALFLMTAPNEIVFGFLCCEVRATEDLAGESLLVHVADAKDVHGVGSSMCIPLIQKTPHTCELQKRVVIGAGDWVGLECHDLPTGTKLIGYALGAIHPSKMGGFLFVDHSRGGPRDAAD